MQFYTSEHGYTMCEAEEDQKIKPAGMGDWPFSAFDYMEVQKCRADIVYFAETYIFIESKFQGAVKIRLFEYQKNMLKCWQENKLAIAMLPRQSGKTQLAAIFILWWACFKKNQKILIASKDQDGADEIMDRLWYAYEELPWFLKPGVIKNDVKTKTFENRSRIKSTATTPTSGRGKSNNLIYCLAGETTVRIRNKKTLVEEEISLQDLYNRLHAAEAGNNEEKIRISFS